MHRTISESEFFANNKVAVAVADPDVYPRSQILIFIYPGSNNSKNRGGVCCLTFFVATNITKFKIILILNWKKYLRQFAEKW